MRRLGTIRVQLVLWYLGVLAVLLLALGVFQSYTLAGYLRSNIASSMRQGAYGALRVLGPCFVGSAHALNVHAENLAQLLGSAETAVKIVTPAGQVLADHGFGFPGAYQPLHLSATTIRRLIASQPTTPIPPALRHLSCRQVAHEAPGYFPHRSFRAPVQSGDLVLVALPLGSPDQTFGYALVARSFASGTDTIKRTEFVFALGALVALILAAIVALPLINRALRPLQQVTDSAEAIAAGDLQRRANLPQSRDEIGRLGRSFDTMVDRLQSALNAANASEERMRRFLADASHELRTPLTVLRGMSEVLLRQGRNGPPEMVSALTDMNQEAVRLSRLVDDLLTLTRLDAGQPLHPEPVYVRRFLTHFIERYAGAWPQRHLELELDGLDGATALVDPDALRRVITNLVDNAARYSTPGEPIEVAGSAKPDGIEVVVRDHGPGLSPGDAERVFERFYRGVKSRSRNSGGTGLGLSIVQGLVQQSGGEVRIDTAPDRGTTVTVCLPYAAEEPGVEDPLPAEPAAQRDG